MRGLVGTLALVVVVAFGCGPSPTPSPSPAPTATPTPAPGPVAMEAVDGHVHLVVKLATTRLRVGEELSGTATLSLEGIDRVDGMASSGGPIDFVLTSADGATSGFVRGVPDLRGFTLTADKPLVNPIPAPSVFNWSGPGSWRAPGKWTLAVHAGFFAPTAEKQDQHHLEVSIPLEVAD